MELRELIRESILAEAERIKLPVVKEKPPARVWLITMKSSIGKPAYLYVANKMGSVLKMWGRHEGLAEGFRHLEQAENVLYNYQDAIKEVDNEDLRRRVANAEIIEAEVVRDEDNEDLFAIVPGGKTIPIQMIHDPRINKR